MKNSHYTAFSILNREANVDLGLTTFGIMSDASWSHLVLAKVEDYLIRHL